MVFKAKTQAKIFLLNYHPVPGGQAVREGRRRDGAGHEADRDRQQTEGAEETGTLFSAVVRFPT